jgi:dCTP diphosphatase
MPASSGNGPSLTDLQESVRAFRDERDWEQFHTPKDLAAALAIEAGELQELLLWQSTEQQDVTLQRRHDDVRYELADIVILALAFAERAGIDLSAAITDKLALNAAKYPVERARGRSDKYDRL